MNESNQDISETDSFYPLIEPLWLEKHLDDPTTCIVNALGRR